MKRIPLVLALVWIVAAPSLLAQVPRRPFLFKDGRSEIAAARARGDHAVTLVIASMPGANARLARTITELGGTIRFRDDDVDYLRARVPVGSVERLEQHPALHSVDVTKPQRVRETNDNEGDDGAKLSTDTTKRVWPPELSDYPLANRYSPLADIGAAEFRKANPTFDGRGVTIAMIDLNADPLLPELQVATTLDGRPTPKIVVYETVIDLDEQDDGRWMQMTDTVVATDARFTYQDEAYTAPNAGTFRIAMLDEAKFDSLSRARIDKDLNRDGNPEGSSRLFAVLWDEGTNDVWVDTDQDQTFADEKALTDFSVRPEFGLFGEDKPETPVRESVAFGVQIDPGKQRVALNIGIDRHGSRVVGAAMANRGTSGRFDGVAPGARLANIAEGYASYGQTEAVIRAMKHPLVDVVFLEQGAGITRPYLLRDGRLVPTVIYSRLLEKYRKPLVVPTHNYPILGGIDDLVLARGAIGIGGHESKDNFFANHGVRVAHHDNLLITGGYGPMGNGALKPDVISPSNYVSTSRGFEEGPRFAELFQLPPGYAIAGGTSTATPTAAGGVALLISAAKQTGLKYDAFRIKHAITRSARYVPNLPAYKQGNGVLNVAGAWEILNALDGDGGEVTITSRAPVRHVLSHLLPAPHEGVGLYERDGWTAGDRGERTVTFTRTSGPPDPMTFAVSWTGNDRATYSAPTSVTLPLDTPVPITIAIAPTTPGVHTAIVTLDHASVPGYAYRMLTTVVAAEALNASNDFTIEKETEVPRPGMRGFFYRVPKGVSTLRIDLAAKERAVGLAVIRPDTRQQPGPTSLRTGSTSATVAVDDPMPGMWEVRLSDIADTRTFDWEQAKESEPVPPTPATLTVSALAADIIAEGVGPNVEPDRVTGTYDLSITNRMAAFTGSVASIPMGSARRERLVMGEGEQRLFEVDVLPGSTALVARARNASDSAADIDVYVFDCSDEDGSCWPDGVDADFDGDESVIVHEPAAGKWKIVVDAATAPSGSATFEYLDIVLNPLYGTVAAADSPEERGVGDQWTAKAHTWVTEATHAPGREPFAVLMLQAQPKGAAPFVVSLRPLIASRSAETGSRER